MQSHLRLEPPLRAPSKTHSMEGEGRLPPDPGPGKRAACLKGLRRYCGWPWSTGMLQGPSELMFMCPLPLEFQHLASGISNLIAQAAGRDRGASATEQFRDLWSQPSDRCMATFRSRAQQHLQNTIVVNNDAAENEVHNNSTNKEPLNTRVRASAVKSPLKTLL